jgi:hypothetical protein
MRTVGLVLVLMAWTAVTWAGLDDMIPAAKEVQQLDVAVPTDGGTIRLVQDTRMARIAAAEINSRIEELGGRALGISLIGPDANFRGVSHAWIVLGTAGARTWDVYGPKPADLSVTPDDPGTQGYAIGSDINQRTPTFALAGADEQGLLYAAVTFRHMLDLEDDQVVVRAANVRDWPDFRQRNLGAPFEEPLRDPWAAMHSAAEKGDMERAKELSVAHIEKMQRYIDWLLRHKINMMAAHGSWSGGEAGLTDWEKGVIRQINDYAKQRGITAVSGANISIGRYPQDKDNPDFADIVMHQSHKRYFCWSRLDYHRKKARQIAEYMRDCGYGALYLHDVDGGGWSNPALWDDRCELCKRTYGDDHAKADQVVFGIYYDTMRELIPDAKFFAVIYPYNPNSIDPESIAADLRGQMGDAPGIEQIAENAAAKNRAMLERLNSLVPDDWHICIRENERARIDLIREVWHPKPFYTYFEYTHWKQFQPWFSTSPRMTGTFYYEGYDDVIYGSIPGVGFRNPLRLYAQECAWNSRGPDYETFDYACRNDHTKIQYPRELAERWARKVSADLYGDEVAPYMVPLFTLGLATNFVFDTQAIADRAGLDDWPAIMREQFEAATACAQSMEGLFDKIIAGEITPKQQFSGELTNYYHFVAAARALAGYKQQKAAIEDAIISGDEAGADERIAALEQDLATWERELAHVRERTKGLPIAEESARKTVAKGYLLGLSVDELRQDLQTLLDRKDELIAAYNMPRWFRDNANKREFFATLAEQPIVLDGKLDEQAWRCAEPIEHFLQYDQLRLGSYETVARIAYDDSNLYVAFECFDPAPAEIEIPKRDRDQHEQVDSVEVLVDSNDDDETFVHYILDLGGNLFDAARMRQEDGVLKYEREWDGNLRWELARVADRWIAELAIPASDLGHAPKQGETWGIHVARNIVHGRPAVESVAPQHLDGEGFHSVAKYAPLHLAGPEARVRPPKVEIAAEGKSLEQKVHEEGDATEVKFSLRIETNRSLHSVKAAARLLDAEGNQVLEQTLLERPWLELLWQSRRDVFLEVKRSYEGLLLEIEVSSDEGTWQIREKSGKFRAAAPTEEELYAPGQSGAGDRALAATMFCPSFDYVGERPRHFVPSAQGTIECWLCPTEDVLEDRDAEGLMRTIVDIGPVRYDHPYLTNYRSVALYIGKQGYLVFQITNAGYKSRATQCRVTNWQAGQWHHVAAQWLLDDGGKCRMQIFVDGKVASDRVSGNKEGDADAALERKDEMLPIQVGAMNTGVGEAKMLIDELRFSVAARYQGDFAPAERLSADELTSLLFHFDEGLAAESGLEGVEATGAAGTVG